MNLQKKKTLLQMYHEVASEPYSFLYFNLMQKDKSKMCMSNVKQYSKKQVKLFHILYYDNNYKFKWTSNNSYK